MSKSSVLKDMGCYKSNLISAFLKSNEICELLINKTDYSDDEIDDLLYTHIFPYLYIDEVQTEVKTYICFEVDIPKFSTGTIKDMKLIIWIYSHKEDMKYSKQGYCGTKVDILADIIERQLRDSDEFGIGKLEIVSCTYFIPNKKYYGKQLIYNMPDFKISK